MCPCGPGQAQRSDAGEWLDGIDAGRHTAGPGQAQRSDAGEWLDGIDAGRHAADYLLCGDGNA